MIGAGSSNSLPSAVTGADLSAFVEQEEILNMELLEKEPISTEWTDEKHSLYLKSIETSFVHQLYGSMDLSGLHSHIKNPSQMRSSKQNTFRAADQKQEQKNAKKNAQKQSTTTKENNTRIYEFKVCQHGSWQRMQFESGEPPPQKAVKSRILLQNPWIQRFRNRDGQRIPANASLGSELESNAHALLNISDDFPNFQIIGDSSIGEEHSGQNFDEEDNEETLCSSHTTKRMKTVGAANKKHK